MWVFYLFSCVLALFNNILCHYDDFSNGYHYQKAFPQEVMVDVVNNFGVALLEAHNEDNNNNIALSPYGATSVLIALGEGIRGYAVQEIQEAVRVPQDVSVVRVGLRDIHRHLKSYFIPKEGFLAGLTLNNEKIQLNDEYKEILRFYGFDLDSFNSPLYPDVFETSTAMILNITEDGITTSPFLPTETTVTPEKSTNGDIKSTENPTVTTTETVELTSEGTTRIQARSTDSSISVTTELTTTRITPETTPNEATPRTTEGSVDTTTQQPTVTSTTAEKLTTVTTSVSPTTENATITPEITTIKAEATTIKTETTTIKAETTTVKTEVTTIQTEATTPKDEITTLKDEVTTPKDLTTTTKDETTTQEATKATTEKNLTETTVTAQTEKTVEDGDLEATSTETLSNKDDGSTEIIGTTTDGAKENKKRNSRSIIDYIIARHYDNQLFKKTKYNNNNYVPAENPSFLIYGTVREPNINFMSYDAVLPIAYLPLLNAMALSFPLDSKEYYLLLILPEDETGISKLIHDMAHVVSLKDIITSLRYAHVRAVIPSFMLKGYVVLTPSLQKLGIQRIFEPRRTDFSLMTKEKDVYVTNIEQAVTVTIRNYVDSDNLPNYRNLQRARPVLFQADHPFLYFVMDTEIHVALMAGKIVNPLNSRIR